MKINKGFTLVEIAIVLVIIGVLAFLSVSGYMNNIQKSKDAEAITAAGEIRKAEFAHNLEKGDYVGAGNITEINERLVMDIVPKDYEYRVVGVDQNDFVVLANRIGSEKIVVAMNKDGMMYDGYAQFVGQGTSGGGIISGGGVSGGGSTGPSAGGSGSGGGIIGGGTGGSGSGGGGATGGGIGGGAGGSGLGGGGSGSGGGTGGGPGGSDITPIEITPEVQAIMDILKNSILGAYFYNVLDINNISVGLEGMGGNIGGYFVPSSTRSMPTTIMLNSALGWTNEALASILIHEAIHADYFYNMEKWVDLTTEKYGVDRSQLSIYANPTTGEEFLADTIDQEYNAFVNEILFWKEVGTGQSNWAIEYDEVLYDQGGDFLWNEIATRYKDQGLNQY